jgi:hypothetical protein
MSIESLANATRESANVITAEIRTNTEEVVRNTTVSARQEIAKQEASLMAVRPIIWEQQRAIRDELSRFKLDLENVSKRYDSIFEKLVVAFHVDIRKLGEKIFDLVEDAYQKKIEARITEPMLPDAEPGIAAAITGRESVLENAYNQLESTSDGFITHRTVFSQNFEDWIADDLESDMEESDLSIPYLVVDLGGADRKLAVSPPTTSGPSIRFSSKAQPAASSQLISRMSKVDDNTSLSDALQAAVGRIARVYLADNPTVPSKSLMVDTQFESQLRNALESEIDAMNIDEISKDILKKNFSNNLPVMVAG